MNIHEMLQTQPEYNTEELKIRDRWNSIFREEGFITDIDKTLPKIVDFFKNQGVKRIMDLGCGAGRHTVYLAQRKFEVYGIDIAEEGIKRAKNLLHEKNLLGTLTIGSIHNPLPYDDNFFDSVISIRVIHHGRIESIQRIIKEMERVTRPGGYIYVTVRKRPRKQWGSFKMIAPQTYVKLDGREKDIIHYQFTRRSLREEFKNFKIKHISVAEGYYCLLAKTSMRG